MDAAKFRSIAVALGLAALTSVAYSKWSEDKARDFLAKSLSRESPVNVVAIICECNAKAKTSDGDTMFKVSISKDGKQRKEVLQPLRMQGYLSIDDGKRMKVLMPDDRTLLDQESPQPGSHDLQHRLKLISKNYRLRVYRPRPGESPTVAERPVLIISAKPKADGLPTKRFYIDKKTYFVLRIETESDGEDPVIDYDTKYVSYPAQLAPETFRMDPVVGVVKIHYDRRKSLPSGKAAIKEVGFEPIVPHELPMGFEIQDAQVNNSSDWRSVVLRITDGIAMASIYEWKPQSGDGRPQNRARDINGVRVLIKADFSSDVSEKLLDTFGEASDNPSLEQSPQAPGPPDGPSSRATELRPRPPTLITIRGIDSREAATKNQAVAIGLFGRPPRLVPRTIYITKRQTIQP